MEIETIYEDNDILVVNKPSGLTVFNEDNMPAGEEKTLADYLIEQFPYLKESKAPRYGIAHRLDKDTSGALLVAKTDKSLIFLQKQFSAAAKALADRKNRPLEKIIEKRYIALVVGEIKDKQGVIETLLGRSPKDGKKQKVFLMGEPGAESKRQAITEYRALDNFNGYTLLEVAPKTGRKHQIRCHLAYIQHPIAGDKVYGFKGQPTPKGLSRHFLHASYLKFQTLSGETKEVNAELPDDLKDIINQIKTNL